MSYIGYSSHVSNSGVTADLVADPSVDLDTVLPCGLASDICSICFSAVLCDIYWIVSFELAPQHCSGYSCVVILNSVYH